MINIVIFVMWRLLFIIIIMILAEFDRPSVIFFIVKTRDHS